MPFGLDAGGRGMDRLLALPEPPTAVFAFTDEVALSALRSLVAHGVDIPAGMSVIGVDDHPHAELIGLTTVDQGIEEQGLLSGEMAVRLLRGEALEQRTVMVPSRLIVRGTTAPPPERGPSGAGRASAASSCPASGGAGR